MRKVPVLVLCAIIFGILVTSACGANPTPTARLVSVEPTTKPDPPTGFQDLKNPFFGDRKVVSEGEKIYEASCASCHGPTGKGDGPAGAALEPEPSNLATIQSELSDSYLYWRISEGGLMVPFTSMMPAWRGLLREEQIWAVVSYLRTLKE